MWVFRMLFPGECETWKQWDFYATDITAQMHQAVSTRSWEKNSHHHQQNKKKPTLSNRLHLLKSPKERKVSRMEEKNNSLLSPTNTSWSLGQSWICMGLPDNWALSRQKPMHRSPDRNSVNPQPLSLAPPLALTWHPTYKSQLSLFK